MIKIEFPLKTRPIGMYISEKLQQKLNMQTVQHKHKAYVIDFHPQMGPRSTSI